MNNWKFDSTSYYIGGAIGAVAMLISGTIVQAISKKCNDEIDRKIKDIEDDILITAVYDIGRVDGMVEIGNDIANGIKEESLSDNVKEIVEKGDQLKKDSREGWDGFLNKNQKETLDKCRNR